MGRKSSEKPLYTCPLLQTRSASSIPVASARGFTTRFDKKGCNYSELSAAGDSPRQRGVKGQETKVEQNCTSSSEKSSNRYSADRLWARTRRAHVPTLFQRSGRQVKENLRRASSAGAHQRLPPLMRQHRTTYPRICHQDRYLRAGWQHNRRRCDARTRRHYAGQVAS